MKRILLIEENDRLAKLYHDDLLDEGFEITVSRNFEFNMLNQKPDLAVFDISRYDETTHILLSDVKNNCRLPIIVLYELPFQNDEFILKQVDSLVMKSGDLTELNNTISSCLNN